MPADWHRLDVEPDPNTGVPTVGFVLTVCDEAAGPLQPEAVAVTTELPLQPFTKVTAPVAVLMVLPADKLAPSKL